MKNKVLYLFALFFAKKYFYNFGKILQHLSHRMMGIGNYENFILSGEKNISKTIFNFYNKKKFVYFDVGAGRNSETSQLILNHFPNANGYLFEPMPETYKALKSKYKSSINIHCHQVALSDKNGYLKLYDYENKQTQHATAYLDSLKLSKQNISKHKVIKTTIDEFVLKNKIKKINYLKVDVEGQEYAVLTGAIKCIHNIDFIQFEFNSMNIYSKTRFIDFYELLSKSFVIYRMYQNELLQIYKYEPIYQEIYEFQNYFCVNKKYEKISV